MKFVEDEQYIERFDLKIEDFFFFGIVDEDSNRLVNHEE